jgi:hypothetical protein
VFEKRLRQLQYEHERALHYRSDQRQLRDLKLARVRQCLGQLAGTSVRVKTLTTKLSLMMQEDDTGFWDRQLREGSKSMAEMSKEIEGAVSLLLLDVEAVELATPARQLMTELDRLGVLFVNLTVLDTTRAAESAVHSATQALLDQQWEVTELANKLTAAARSVLNELERALE